MLTPVRIAAPQQAPITLDQAKQHLRILHDDEDEYIADLIEAATDYLDGYSGVLGKALITQTWRQDYPAFYSCDTGSLLRLPLGPVQSITSVAYYDPANSLQTLSASVYELLNDGLGPYVALIAGQSWPAIYSRAGAVRVTWIAGYGATPETVPQEIRWLIKANVAGLYEQRESLAAGQPITESPAVQAVLATSRIIGF